MDEKELDIKSDILKFKLVNSLGYITSVRDSPKSEDISDEYFKEFGYYFDGDIVEGVFSEDYFIPDEFSKFDAIPKIELCKYFTFIPTPVDERVYNLRGTFKAILGKEIYLLQIASVLFFITQTGYFYDFYLEYAFRLINLSALFMFTVYSIQVMMWLSLASKVTSKAREGDTMNRLLYDSWFIKGGD